jgi:hypothetical protein
MKNNNMDPFEAAKIVAEPINKALTPPPKKLVIH